MPDSNRCKTSSAEIGISEFSPSRKNFRLSSMGRISVVSNANASGPIATIVRL